MLKASVPFDSVWGAANMMLAAASTALGLGLLVLRSQVLVNDAAQELD
jgi:hypothetical protein